MTDTPRFKDFSLAPEGPEFRIAPDTFRCYPEIPLDVMLDLVEAAAQKVEGIERIKQLFSILAGVIVAEDYDRFMLRTRRGTKENPNPSPIGMRHIRDLLPWVMEVYGMRPTQASSESATGSDDASTSSTEPVSDEVLTS